MANKIYTAQEMRDMAFAVIDDADCYDEGGVAYDGKSKFKDSIVAAMLHQAADMMEREKEVAK